VWIFNQIFFSIDGNANFFTAVKVAQLSLKHRQNKSQRQRVIIFVGHPLNEEIAECEDLGKRLKRNNVAIDVINFAHPENVPKLQALVNCANNSENSHFLDVPMGVSMITDVLFTSPILGNEDGGMSDAHMANAGAAVPGGLGADTGAGQFAEYGGINPDLDPELAMALKVSLEEDRAKQNQETAEEAAAATESKPTDEGGANTGPQLVPQDTPHPQPSGEVVTEPAAADEDDEEEYDEQYYLD